KSESRVARALMDAAGATVSVERLHSACYVNAIPGDGLPKRGIVSVYVYNVRKKMPAGAGEIVTVWGEGYRYEVGKG
ncbi:winged helix-turn-helix domain-containing protein, partial [Arenibacterium halophilum]